MIKSVKDDRTFLSSLVGLVVSLTQIPALKGWAIFIELRSHQAGEAGHRLKANVNQAISSNFGALCGDHGFVLKSDVTIFSRVLRRRSRKAVTSSA